MRFSWFNCFVIYWFKMTKNAADLRCFFSHLDSLKIFIHYISVDDCKIYFIHAKGTPLSRQPQNLFFLVLCLLAFKRGTSLLSRVLKPLCVWKKPSWSGWYGHWDVWALQIHQLLGLRVSVLRYCSHQRTDDFFLHYNSIPPGWLMINSHIFKEYAIC